MRRHGPETDGTRRPTTQGTLLLLMAALAMLSLPPSARSAKVETWRQDTASAFAKGRKQGVVVSDAGRVRLAQGLGSTSPLGAARVWDLARAGGAWYAATGDEGKVFRRDDQGEWTRAFDANDSQALALAALPDGRVFVGTGPGGQVVEVTDPKQPSSRPDPAVQYIWDLAADAAGNLYAATGPAGQLWKRAADGRWSLVFDSPRTHLLSVAVGCDGAAFAGSDGEGLLYRVGPDGKASVLYDAPQAEVRTLLVAPDGALYAGTASDSAPSPGGASGPSRSLSAIGGGLPGLTDRAAPSDGGVVAAAALAQAKPEPEARPAPTPGGTAAPKPGAPGENAVYRVGPDGVPREVFRAKVLIFALAWQGDRLLIGTGPEGQLFEVRGLGREASPIARLDHGQVLALQAEPGGEVFLGAGDPGAVLRLDPGFATQGSLTSEVLDTKLVSRFGALTWRAERPEGTSVSIQVRTGNVGEPDTTWSAWSAPQTDPAAARAEVPPGRFAQYRVDLATRNPEVSPALRAIALRYQTANLPPEIGKVEVPDLGEADGATRQTKLTLKWEVTDPNGDDLSYTLHIRKEGWPDWVRLGEAPLTEKTYAWDTTAVPAGVYRVRVTASDRPSNAPAESLARDRLSEPFLVDHQAPTVTVTPKGPGAAVALQDDLTRLVKAAYALDGGEWVPVFPEDGLFDTTCETLTVAPPDLKPGLHILMVRATDAAGNVGTGDAVLTVP